MSTDAGPGWGILATGKIAHAFAHDLTLGDPARLGHVAAAGSRRLGSARTFADEHGGTAYGSYAELVAAPEVDVVYVASPHALHLEHARLALEAGKPVLCEKPLTLDAAAAREMVALARERGLFLMEAMWMACHPVVRRLRALLRSGEYGVPGQVRADLGFLVEAPPEDRMFDPALGASALLDMGVYPLTFAHLMLGEPEELTALARLSERGVDLDIVVAGRYAGGALAALTASMTSASPRSATVATDRGRFEVPADFHKPDRIVFTPYEGEDPGTPEVIAAPEEDPVIGQGYGNEAAEVVRCLEEGLLESPWVPHAQTLSLMDQMDRLRDQVGVVFGDPPRT